MFLKIYIDTLFEHIFLAVTIDSLLAAKTYLFQLSSKSHEIVSLSGNAEVLLISFLKQTKLFSVFENEPKYCLFLKTNQNIVCFWIF